MRVHSSELCSRIKQCWYGSNEPLSAYVSEMEIVQHEHPDIEESAILDASL